MGNKILYKKQLSSTNFVLEIHAPLIAKKAKAGQFVMLRLTEKGERIPLTLAGFNPQKGSIHLYFAVVGKTTSELSQLKEGNEILDLLGPLGHPSPIQNYGTALCIGGGIGTAAIFPIARELKKAGNRMIALIGARSAPQLILVDELRGFSDELLISTDDGTQGSRGFVTDVLQTLLQRVPPPSRILAIGPLPMMRAVSNLTKPYGIRTMVSLNPIMVDGTGMCGGCRVTVDGQSKFACVDGPEFDGHEVDFSLLAQRLTTYQRCERQAGNP